MKKRLCALLLCLVLFLTVSVPAFAAPLASVSPQALRVDGRIVNCMKYNIDGNNYLRLRDLAVLVSGTGSAFSIGYDGERRLTRLDPGEAYTPDGSELLVLGDQSDTAAAVSEELLIGETRVSDIAAFQIGTDLYFKLRDLAPYLSIRIEYDELRNVVLLSTLSVAESRYAVSEVTQAADGSVTSIVSRSYDARGSLTEMITESAAGVERRSYTYRSDGLPESETIHAAGRDTVRSFGYDAGGNLIGEEITLPSGDIRRIDRSFDDLGRILQETSAGFEDDYVLINTYHDDLNTVSSVCSFVSGAVRSSEQSLDIAGNAIAETIQYLAAAYQSKEEIRRTFDAFGNILSETSSFSDSDGTAFTDGFTYSRDSAGNALSCTYADGSVTRFGLRTASELSASTLDRYLSGSAEDADVTGLANTFHHIHYVNMLLGSGSDSVKYLSTLAASRMTDKAGELRYIYSNRLFGCRSAFTFFENDAPTMTGTADLHGRVLSGEYAFQQDIAGLEGIWLSGSDVSGISADRAAKIFNAAWDEAEWQSVQRLCTSPEAYYLFVYGRDGENVLRVQYLIPDALNIADTAQAICLQSGNEFGLPVGGTITAELGLGPVVLR